jgi:hypothetical protein
VSWENLVKKKKKVKSLNSSRNYLAKGKKEKEKKRGRIIKIKQTYIVIQVK